MKIEEYSINQPISQETLNFVCNLGDMQNHDSPGPSCIATYPSFVTKTEAITPNSEGGRKMMKSFEHYKCVRGPSSPSGGALPIQIQGPSGPHWFKSVCNNGRCGVTGYTGNGSQVFPFGEPGFPLAGLPAFRTARPDGGFIPTPSNFGYLERIAMQTMLPLVKAELSLINSLIELKDFSSLPRTIANATSIVKGISARGSARLRELLRGGSDGYLQVKFNVLPLLSDISGIGRALSRTERRINDLISRAGRPQRKHFAYSWAEFDDTTDESSDGYLILKSGEMPFNQWSACYLSRNVINEHSKFHAQVEYNYNYTQYQREHAHLLGLLDALGVNLNPAIIWNALPWSFVVDWLVNVSSWLNQFKLGNLEPQINIRNYLWSVKRSRRILTWKHSVPLVEGVSGYPNGTTVQLPTVYETSYRRHASGSVGASSIESSGLSSTEVSLGAALVLARRR